MPAQQLVERTKGKISAGMHLPVNPSSQQLVKEPTVPMYHIESPSNSNNRATRHHRNNITVAVLVYVNLINYMDRLTIAGILDPIQREFGANNAMMGLLQTAFIMSYMVFAPLFGYLGDRYSRRNIMAAGVFLWSVFTLIGSFMSGSKENRSSQWSNGDYWAFLGCRAMVGIGEASYSTIAPTIISDMFVKEVRSKMLALFYFAIPVGSGLGYIVGSKTADVFGSWQWGLRATPVLGMVAVLLILFLLEDPPRGQSEGHGEMQAQSYKDDLLGLAKNKSFVYSTLAFTCVTFCTGALSWWGPVFITKAILTLPPDERVIEPSQVALIFGALTMMSGIIGVPLGMFLSTKLKARYPRADPVICGSGILISAVFLTAGMLLVKNYLILAFILLFIGEVALNLNWSIVADILLYVVVPTCRSTAEAVQILFSHAFGDAGSPYLIGLISDGLKTVLDTTGQMCSGDPQPILPNNTTVNSTFATGNSLLDTTMPDLDNNVDLFNATAAPLMGAAGSVTNTTAAEVSPCTQVEYTALLYSLLSNSGVELIGAILFFATAIYIVRDKLKCEQASIASRNEGQCEIKMMLPRASPEESVGEEFPSDDELPQLVNDSSRSTSPV